MAISRRQFLKRTGLATGGLVGASLFSNPFVRRALAGSLDVADRYFIVVFLDGGNDGLNTVTPVSGALRTAYDTNRSSVNLSPGALAATTLGNNPGTGTPIALHPAMTSFMPLWTGGDLAVFQGCGYPDYSLSHEGSRHVWETANPLGLTGVTEGWIGQHLAADYLGTDIPAVNITNDVSGSFRQSATGVLTVRRLRRFGFPVDFEPGASEDDLKKAKFGLLSAEATGSPIGGRDYLGKVGSSALLATGAYPGLHQPYVDDRPSFDAAYDALDDNTGYSLGDDLREVAKIMYGVKNNVTNVKARFFEVRNGGFDTHSNQGGATGDHADLLREVADSIKTFWDDITDMGLASKTCLIVFSEFARRIEQNASGTDHGSQGPMFVVGGTVNGNTIYGNHPDIINDASSGGGSPTGVDDNGNTVYTQAAGPYRSTDFRDVYGTILKHWFNASPALINSILPADGGPDPDYYWNTRNFDLPFLP